MSAFFQWYLSGKVFGLRYHLLKGESIPLHAHTRENAHNVIVLEGAVVLHVEAQKGDGFIGYHLRSGQIFDFDGSRPHWIEGTARQSIILNLFLEGMPQGYDQVPAEHRQGYI